MGSTLEAANNLSKIEAAARAAFISDISYTVTVDFTQGDETFISDSSVEFSCSTKGQTTFIDLLPRKVQLVEINGEKVKPDLDGVKLRLTDLAERNTVRVVAECEYTKTGVGIHRFVDPADGLVYLYSDLEPFEAHRAYACFDQPDMKATFAFNVKVPAGFRVISTSKAVVAPPVDRGGIWSFAKTPILSTYVTAICAGPYYEVRDHHKGIDLGLYCRQSLAQHLDPDEIFEITKTGLDYFNDKFGYPYMTDKYDQVFCPEYNQGAMENFACVTVAENYIFRSKVTDTMRERRADTILHEMAHMWFGDLVTMRWWEDLWLNESFATYASVVAQVEATRFRNAWSTFANVWKAWAYAQDQLPTTHPVATAIPDTDSVRSNFDGISYAKGCSALRQLVAWVGEESFFDGLKLYFKDHEYGNAELNDFLSALEDASGRDLRAWSKQWLESAGVNTLRSQFETQDGRFTSFTLLQEAPEEWPTIRAHRLGIGLYDDIDGRLALRRRFEVDIESASNDIKELAGEKVPLLVLINDGDLTYAKIRLDEMSVRTLVDRIGELEDPLTRSMCWSATWDMVRDAEMRSRDFLHMVRNGAPTESQIGLLESLLAKAGSAMAYYIDPVTRPERLQEFADVALRVAREAPAGSDLQLAWTNAFIASARNDEHLGLLRTMLDGERVLPGLAVDTAVRWALVSRLTRSGAAGDDIIEAELQRDPTHAGEQHATAARAGRPTPEAKKDAWETIVAGEVPLDTARSLMTGFADFDQVELLRPYRERYFEVLAQIASEKNVESSLTFANGMFPHVVIDEDTLRMTDEYLQNVDLPSHVQRALREQRDSMARFLRGQRKDADH